MVLEMDIEKLNQQMVEFITQDSGLMIIWKVKELALCKMVVFMKDRWSRIGYKAKEI